MLLEIQSETKLQKIFESPQFAVGRVLRHAIHGSLNAMLTAFRHNCIQHNPHVHYMQPNPLVRVSLSVLMIRIQATVAATTTQTANCAHTYLNADEMANAAAVIALICSINRIESIALVYIEARFVAKFLSENLMRSQEHIAPLLKYLEWCSIRCMQLLQSNAALNSMQKNQICLLLQCIDMLMQQPLIWQELNHATDKNILTPLQRNKLLCHLLALISLASRKAIQYTLFDKRFKQLSMHSSMHIFNDNNNSSSNSSPEVKENEMLAASKYLNAFRKHAILMAHLIETQYQAAASGETLTLNNVAATINAPADAAQHNMYGNTNWISSDAALMPESFISLVIICSLFIWIFLNSNKI